MKFKKFCGIGAAALAAVSAVSVCAFAAADTMELKLADVVDAHGINGWYAVGDGSIMYRTDDSGAVRGILRAKKNDSGEISLVDISTDLDLESGALKFSEYFSSTDGDYFQLYEGESEYNVTKRYVLRLDKTSDKAVTVYTPSADAGAACFTRGDGCTVTIVDGAITVYDPDGTVMTDYSGDDDYYAYIAGTDGGKYAGYLVKASEADGYTICGIGLDGSETVVGACAGEGDLTLNSAGEDHVVLHLDETNVFVDFNSGKVITGENPDDFDIVSSGKTYNNLIVLGSNRGYGLYDILKEEYVTETAYSSLLTRDGGVTYLARNESGKWICLDADGNESVARFDSLGAFIGDYAPAVKNGEGYLIDRNFVCVSEILPATSADTVSAELFCFTDGDQTRFVTFNVLTPTDTTPSEPASSTVSTASDTSADTSSDVSSTVDNDKGATVAAAGAIVAAAGVLAVAAIVTAVVVSRRKR